MNRSQAERLMKQVDPNIEVRMVSITKGVYCINYEREGEKCRKTVTTEKEFIEFLGTL